MKNLDKLVRDNIKALKPYSSARGEFQGTASAFLDANENPYNDPYNRYPDPLQRQLKKKISEIKHIPEENIFLGNGSDEPIDLVVRIFCEPHVDNIVAIDPSYGMYQVAADTNAVEYRKVLLSEDFSLDAARLLKGTDSSTKIIFLCSPNNPTGNYLDEKEVVNVIEGFDGIVVLDEAYIDFSAKKGLLDKLNKFPNLIILQTFSKAWGLASIRLGIAFASKQIIALFNKIKYPYNINYLTQQFALDSLNKAQKKDDWVEYIKSNRELLVQKLSEISIIEKIYPTDANFFLIKVRDPKMVYEYLVENKIIVRNRSSVSLCAGCLRITVGSQEENDLLVTALKKY